MPLADDVPTCALAVYAHPDDPEIAAGGTLAKWAAAGTEVWVLIVAQGEKGTLDPDGRSRPRSPRSGCRRPPDAAALLGFAGHRHLGYRDGEVPDDRALRGAIVRTVRELQPEVVLCPDPTSVLFGDGYFNHHDHRVTGWATLDAVASAAANPHYFPEQIGEGLAVHQVARCTSPAPSSRTRGSTSATRSNARSMPCSVTPASCATRGSGSASSCATVPKRPAPRRRALHRVVPSAALLTLAR